MVKGMAQNKASPAAPRKASHKASPAAPHKASRQASPQASPAASRQAAPAAQTSCTLERIEGLEPYVPSACRLLILGSMPSVKSLEQGFYYANPQNRMFKILHHYALAKKEGRIPEVGEVVLNPKIVLNTKECQEVLETLSIGMYDVVKSCLRQGSLDSEIKEVEYADIISLLKSYPSIKAVATAGGFAAKEFKKSTLKHLKVISSECDLANGILAQYALDDGRKFFHIPLPSTSPAYTIKLEKLKLSFDQALIPLLFS